ncbi:MAG TPA: O-antigen ligase family protein [Caulobacter sp.]|nr:O-antigen ligase family protein [Caulobacter sp.]
MTVQAPAWPAPEARRTDLWDWLAFGLAVFLVLIYSQGWIVPIFGAKIDAGSSGAIRNVYFPAYAAGIGLLAMVPGATVAAMIRQPFLLLLLLIVALSTLWSIAPDQTVRRIIAVYATTLGGVVLATRFRWAGMAEVLAVANALLVIGSFAWAILPPHKGIMTELFPGAWRGLWTEKNALGGDMAMAFGIFAAAALLNPRRRVLWWSFAGLALALVLLSTSKTSLVSLILGAGTVGFVWFARRGPVSGVAATWAAVLGALLLAGFLLLASDVFLQLLGKDATLTGRTKIWAAALRQAELRPWTGYGYAAVWDDKSGWGPLAWITREAGFKPSHAHNAWLEQWLGLGYGGLLAWILFYLQTMAAAIASVFSRPAAYLALPYLVIYSLLTLTESVAVTYNDLRWSIFVALAVKLAWRGRD